MNAESYPTGKTRECGKWVPTATIPWQGEVANALLGTVDRLRATIETPKFRATIPGPHGPQRGGAVMG